MINIEYVENLDDEVYKLIDTEFNKFATQNEIICNYTTFNFIAKEDNKIIGIITGHSYYKEVHIEDLIVLQQYRSVEEFFKEKGFENINLTTYNFQAPEFYKKCGYKIEFIRESKEDPKLNKYFFIKNF